MWIMIAALLLISAFLFLVLGGKKVVPGTYNPPGEDPDIFITTFNEYLAGSQPADWTSRYVTGGFTALVQPVAGSLSGSALRWTKTVANRQGLSWDKVPLVADSEVLMRYRSIEAGSSGEGLIAAYQRGGGAPGTETGYRMVNGVNSTNLQSGYGSYVAGTLTTLGTPASPLTLTVNNWYWSRVNIQGTTLKRRTWAQGSAEPGTWDETITNSAVASAGWTGLQQASANPDTEIDFFGVALNGKTVPARF